MSDAAVLACRDMGKCFTSGPSNIEVLKGIDLEVYAGELLVVTGKSGAGKTTVATSLARAWLRDGPVVLAAFAFRDPAEYRRRCVRRYRPVRPDYSAAPAYRPRKA